MDCKEIIQKYENVQSLLSLFFLELDSFIEEELKKEKNKEEYNERVVKNAIAIRMHAAHALGELTESKACFTDDLNLPDLLCKSQYETELNEALGIYSKFNEFKDIIEGEDK